MVDKQKAYSDPDYGEPRLTLEAAAIERLQMLNAKLFLAPDIDSVLGETMDAARTLLGADMGSAEIYDAQNHVLRLVAQRGFAKKAPRNIQSIKPGNGSVCALALEARERVVLEDILTEPRCAEVRVVAASAGIRGALATPLVDRDGNVLAVISSFFRRPHRPTDAELGILDLVVRQATHLIERFKAEEALRRSERQFAVLFEQASCGIARVGLDERLTMVNDRYCEILGRSREELLKLRIRDITHPDDVPRNLKLLHAAIADGGEYGFEKRYVRGDGSVVWAWVDVSAILDAHGTTVAMMGICQDITQRKQAEEALREADRRKDEFLATLAHELRNPLSPICNGLELLTGQGRDPEFFDDIHATLTRQTQHMLRLVDDLLDVSRITRGKIELRKARVDVASVVASAVETARPIIDASGHRLDLTLPARALVVDADASRLSQVLSNLLNNAAKYMEPGGVIALSAAPDGGDAVIRVKDQGVGIAPELLEKIFDLFTQADPSMERSHGGLGIGLTIVKRLVEMHNGKVVARSAGLGRGSEFIVRLPLDGNQALETERTPIADEAPVAARRVLVIDDNPSVQKALCMLLRTLGHEVRGASDGLAGVALAAEFRPEVVLLDLAMPKCSGFETARRLREQSWARDVVLIALTGWGQEEARQRTKEAGFDYHFVKPIEGRVLQGFLAHLPNAGGR